MSSRKLVSIAVMVLAAATSISAAGPAREADVPTSRDRSRGRDARVRRVMSATRSATVRMPKSHKVATDARRRHRAPARCLVV